MNVGLNLGAVGSGVERLQRVLTFAGLMIEATEIGDREFGRSTLAALHELQRRRGLPESDEIDESTYAVLIEIEQNVTININEGSTPTPSPPDQHAGRVSGTLTDGDGAPVSGVTITLLSLGVRSETAIGRATTDRLGAYSIRYWRTKPLNLAVRSTDRINVLATSATTFAAAVQIVIDFTTAPDGVVRQPSLYTKLVAEVTAALDGTPLSDLKENLDSKELTFLADSIGESFTVVASLFLAHWLSAEHGLQDATLFGIFNEGIPSNLQSALNALPDAGIDETFAAQVLTGVLTHARTALQLALDTAVSGDILPASYSQLEQAELTVIDGLRVVSVGSSPYVRGKTSLNDLLVAGAVPSDLQTAFVQALAADNGNLGPAWTALRANKNIPAADLTTLNTVLSAGELLTGNLPLVKDALQRLADKSLATISDLALLDESDWVARIAAVDPEATSIPQVLPADTAAERILRFAKALAARFAGRFATTAFRGGLLKATSSAFTQKDELVSFLAANTTFNLHTTSIDQYLVKNSVTISPPGLSELKTAQRLHRVSPHYATVNALLSAGYTSAQSIYFKGRAPFIQHMTTPMGSAPLAATAYARAQMTYATSLMALGKYNGSFTGLGPVIMSTPQPTPGTLANLPDLQALFGSLDYFQCDDCQSVYSPAAYLVDLLQYLSWFTATPLPGTTPPISSVATALDALLFRRPEIQYVALSCDNTNIVIPYIDLVNEILEVAVAPAGAGPPVNPIETVGTTAERRALPQQTQPIVAAAAYVATKSVVFPITLPFDLDFARSTAYIAALGTSRSALLNTFPNLAGASALAGAALKLNQSMQNVINSVDSISPWVRWGLAQKPTQVIDPETNQPYSPNPADWVAAMNKVPVFENRAGLSLQQLFQLLEVVWVTQSGVTLQLGFASEAGIQVLSSSTDDMVFTGLTSDVLDRANRFLRLWNATGLQMWELDWALEKAAGGVLDDTFLTFLSGVIAVKTQLKLPVQEVLTLWAPLETRDVVSHLGDEDAVVPSTYGEIFMNAAVAANWSLIFVPLSPAIITAATNASPIAITTALANNYQTGMQVTITGVVGNTAANGTFSVTVTSSNTFTLNGTVGNGAWTSGGSAVALLSGNSILGPSSAPPTAEQNAITASLGLNAQDIGSILAATGAANSLTLATLAVLVQYQRLASSLSLSVSDLIIFIQLTGGTPFNGAPSDTVEFCRRVSVLQGTGIAVNDLNYLLRGQSATQSALAFTATQATAVLQTICNAVTAAVAAGAATVTAVTQTTPISVTTAQPHGLPAATTNQVFVTGVGGNTATDGLFNIVVTSPTSFTLTGSSANAAWTGGGSVVTDVAGLDTAIQTSVIAALVAATNVIPDVITPVLKKTAILPLPIATIQLLLAQSTVDPTQFPTLIAAFTQVAMASALYTALAPSTAAFSFVVANAGTFGWLDPSALPLNPVRSTPYTAFEVLLRALKLQQRQAARSPKLVDVLGAWITGPVPADLPTAIGGPSITVAGATDATPIVITTTAAHGLASGTQVTITGVLGNTAANGTFTITVTGPDAFTLIGSVGNGAYTSGGSVESLSAPALALALNASIPDVQTIATALGATAPSLVLASQPGTLADMAMLTSIAAALDVARRYSISGSTLVQLAAPVPDSSTSTAATGAFQAQYPQSAWLGAVQPVEDGLRQARRDALVAYLLGPGSTSMPGAQFLTTDDIFNYFLIDPEMCACGETTRLLQPSLAIQQFVQQAFLNLTVGVTVDSTDSRWSEWSWRQQYRLWEANREVFLYPENYVLPELRTNASSFFTDLESDLQQSNCDADACEAAYENYLRKLVSVARLVVAAHYNQVNGTSDGSTVLWVFAHTRGTPPQWYYRTRTTPAASSGTPPTGVWSAWTSMNLDIPAGQLVPVIWDQKLYLIWPTFKQVAEKQGNQTIPGSSGGGSAAPAAKYWAVQFAMSEFSAGRWQAKRTIDEKMYFNTEDPSSCFTFKAFQDSSFNLQLQVYYSDPTDTDSLAWYSAEGTMSLPDAPLSVVELGFFMPSSDVVDLTQEPTYSLISGTSDLYNGPLLIQPTPSFYNFNGQDLVYGGWWNQNTGQVPLYVMSLSTSTGSPGSVEVLGKITNPRIVPPQQEMIFDSADPFFVADNQNRTYLVQPRYYTVGSRPQELDSLTYIKQWTTEYRFLTFYHPYARTFLRELEIGGVTQLLTRNLQLNPQQVRGWPTTFNFQSLYNPQPVVAKPYPGVSDALPGQIGGPDPGETWLDFDPACGGAYSLYNWEIFYHVPMFIASQLMQNNQYQDTMTWLKYIFNPTDNSGGPVPQRFWEFAPFNRMNASDWANQQIQNLLTTLAADTQQGISDTSTTNAILAWMNDPYDPHMVASMRIAAYGKATVMQFLNLLIAWGDSYYAQYTSETVSQAEQLYVLADMILGPQPDQLRIPASQQSAAPTYASLKNLDMFSNVLVNVENVIIAPEPPQSLVDGSSTTTTMPTLLGNGSALLFCIPPNDQLLAYWGTVAQRLYNIRHCLNQQGVAQPLPLYAPPINPLQLIAEAAEGATSFGAAAAAPIYRFATYLQRAVEFTNDVRSYGTAILSALEKQDAENLATLRATQELAIQTAMLTMKNQQLTEAQDQVTVLQNQQAVTQIRYNYYSTIVYMNPWEITALALQAGALIANGVAMVLDLTAGVAYAIPKITAGASGFGGSPTVTVSFGGENVGNAAVSAATVSRTIAGILTESASMSATMGSYQRRQDESTLQANLAQAELTQIASQIVTANDRVNIATTEVNIQNTQINNAQAISDFLTNKYTNAQLYNWMLTQLTTVYTQAYQLAYSLALLAQSAYRYELGRPTDVFIQSSYWSSQYKGLTAGDSLLFDLRRMDSQYLANNLRELELTKHISLALTQPLALAQLLQSGSCTVALDETLFDHDYPGQYFRRLRSVALTVPCVTGPYTGIHGTLSLGSSIIRTVAPSAPYTPFVWATSTPGSFPNGISAAPTVAATPIIATSTGQNDAGLFEVNFRDERWLPFEGQGVVSTWNFTLDPRDNDFDLSTVTDVIMHFSYSARPGGDPEAVRTALKPINQRTILLSVRNTFSNALYEFYNPADTTATQQQLTLPLLANVFPFSNLGTPFITDVTMYVAFTQPMSSALTSALSGIAMDATFGPTGSATPASIVVKPVTSISGGGGAETAAGGGPVAALSADAPMTAPTALGSFTLTLPQTSLPSALETLVGGQERLDPTQIEDIFLVITYEVK
jgi:hypothetical protein